MSASIAETLIDRLPLKKGADKTKLVQRLELYMSQIPTEKKSHKTNETEKRRLERIVQAIIELEAVLNELEGGAIVKNYGKRRTFRRYPTNLDVLQLQEAVLALKPIKSACEIRLAMASKPGARTDLERLEIAIKLATLYYTATGKQPTRMSGCGGGEFFAFVQDVLDGKRFNAETVTRLAVDNWKAASGA